MPRAPKRKYARRLQPADRREQLLDAALRIVAEAGFTSVSIAAVAERGGVTRPVVYDSFGSRGELLEALIERETARMAAAVARSTATTPDFGSAAPEQLPAMLGHFLTEVCSMPDTWRLIYFPIDSVPPALRDPLTAARDELRSPLRQALGRWLTEQPDADGVDPDVLAQVVQCTIQTAAGLVLDHPEQFGIDRILALFDYLFLRAPVPASEPSALRA
ncbi:TetR/AcrR family transcriptional regulator [Nocardia sp. NPDC049707]|uniref:TetR/AcrR family transcriptional regulator n=1 Tax=Nocardia sp. NPDC049707 TaxID=3154735 RepID=UPI0034343EE3